MWRVCAQANTRAIRTKDLIILIILILNIFYHLYKQTISQLFYNYVQSCERFIHYLLTSILIFFQVSQILSIGLVNNNILEFSWQQNNNKYIRIQVYKQILQQRGVNQDRIQQIKLLMNPQQTRQHSLNTSGSKFAYKFCKDSRFKAPKILNHNIYTIDPARKTRACGFGFGERSPLAKNTCTPAPTNYNIPSTLTPTSKTFASSREQTKFQSFLMKALREANGPSPATYTLSSSLNKRTISMGERLPTQIDLKTKIITPPPNIYNVDAAGCASTGKYFSSRYKNARKIYFFGRDTATEAKSFSIGPGSYNLVQDYSLDQSKFKKTVKSFGTADRPTPDDKSKKFMPGPGMYQTFSQFPSCTN